MLQRKGSENMGVPPCTSPPPPPPSPNPRSTKSPRQRPTDRPTDVLAEKTLNRVYARAATWEGLYEAACEAKKIKETLATISVAGFVAAYLRPALASIETQLEHEALKQFGLMGRLALDSKSLAKACEKLNSPVKVLAYGVHSAIISLGLVCTGSQVSEFNQSESWPNFIPDGFVNDGGTTYSMRYRPKSMAADKLIVKGVLQGDNFIVSCSDPYSSGASASVVHLRVKDFVKSKSPGEPPTLIEAKERELLSVVEERMLPAAGLSKSGPTPRTSSLSTLQVPPPSLQVPTAVAFPIGRGDLGFQGDLMPGVGGSMLFGPGNPQFDRGLHPSMIDPRTGRSMAVPPGARYDPIGPFVTGAGEPDPDDEPMPNRNRTNIF